jgi:glycosyltransferase involved in cell wall biosynthesis
MTCALDVWALSGQGGAPSLFKTVEAYARRGHELHVVSPTIGANHHFGEPPAPAPRIDGVTFHRFHLPSLQESRIRLPSPVAKTDQKLRFALLFPYMASRAANRLLRRTDFDLLYGYEVHGVLAARLVRRKRRLPLVARFQGTVMHPHLEGRLGLARKYEEVLALKTPADLYVMTDDGTRGDEVLERLNPASSGRVRFWRNGIDLDYVRAPTPDEEADARASLGLAPDEFVLVTAARLARWKRIDRAIDALALLRDKLPAAGLIIVGDGEERANLERQAADLNLGEAVRFVGAVPQQDVPRYLWAADVFLSLNELSNVGNPLLEAMAAGRCILTIDEGDTRDLIRNEETGLLLPDGNPAAVAEALAGLAAQPERRRRLAEAAGRFAAEHFWSWEQRMDAEVDEVEALVSGRAELSPADV